MVVCDICKKKIGSTCVPIYVGFKFRFETKDRKPDYHLCHACYDKTIKWAKFESARKEKVRNKRIARKYKK